MVTFSTKIKRFGPKWSEALGVRYRFFTFMIVGLIVYDSVIFACWYRLLSFILGFLTPLTLKSTLLKMKSVITFQNVFLMSQNIRRGVWAPQTAAHIYRNLKLRIGQPKREMKVLFFLTVVSTFAAQGKKLFLNFDFYENLAETSLNDLSAHDQQRIHDYLNFFSQMVSYRRALEFLITPNTSLELGSILRQETANSKWSGRNLAQDRSQFQHGTSKDACFMTHESWGSLVKTIIVS